MKISEFTISAWTSILSDRKTYLNPVYYEQSEQILQMNIASTQIKLWKNYYCRYMPDYQSTLVSLLKSKI
jgi:hypothetical protein